MNWNFNFTLRLQIGIEELCSIYRNDCILFSTLKQGGGVFSLANVTHFFKLFTEKQIFDLFHTVTADNKKKLKSIDIQQLT